MVKEAVKITTIRSNDDMRDVITDILRAHDKNELNSLVICASIRDDLVQEHNASRLRFDWYGNNGVGCIEILGLLDYMKMEIRDFIRDSNT